MILRKHPLLTSAGFFGLLLVLVSCIRSISIPPKPDSELATRKEEKLSSPHTAIELPEIRFHTTFSSLPDFTQYPAGIARKKAFSTFLVPLIQQVNAHQLELRIAALSLAKAHREIEKKEQAWLNQLCKRYRIKSDCVPGTQLQKQIEIKVDVIPVALALAQGAKESGWGTSRFARQGNNLFGQWCFKPGCGMVPMFRPQEANHEVTRFNSPLAAVQTYVQNLNSHPAYAKLRKNRHEKKLLQPIEYLNAMTTGLREYSGRGQDYVNELQAMLRHNRSWLEHPVIALN